MKSIVENDRHNLSGEEFIIKYFGFVKNSIPDWVYQNTKTINELFLEDEQFTEGLVEVKNIVGTMHPDYWGHPWLWVLINLKRDWVRFAIEKPEYYINTLQSSHHDSLSFIRIDNEYYITSGNHRCTIAKFIGIKNLYGKITVCKLNKRLQENLDFLKKLGISVDKNRIFLDSKWSVTFQNNISWNFKDNESLYSLVSAIQNPSLFRFLKSLISKIIDKDSLLPVENYLYENYRHFLSLKKKGWL